MLTELHLSNFKSWQTLDMQLGQVTGLFGTNSSGKSSILQFLLMLKQTKDATDQGLVLDLGSPNQLVNLGSFKDIIHKHQEKLPLKWELKWIPFLSEYSTKVELFFKNKLIKVKILKSSCKEHSFELNLKSTGKDYLLKIDNKIIFPKKIGDSYFSDKIEKIRPVKTHIFSEISHTSYDKDSTLSSIEYDYESMFDKTYYLGPLREHPKREYQWSGASPMTVGYRGEYAINAILAATMRKDFRTLPNSREKKPFQEIIAYWLRELGLIHEFYIKEIAKGSNLFRAIVKKDKESPETFLTDVGFGVSQILPVLVLLYYVPNESIILMEQPEIHLHPSVQSGLADVILQVAKDRRLQIIVESHSEHLLRRFQRRIAEEKYSANDLKLYFCDMKDGASQLSNLEINEFGEIKNWPPNFFGDEMAEIAATRTAGLKRKMKEAEKNGG